MTVTVSLSVPVSIFTRLLLVTKLRKSPPVIVTVSTPPSVTIVTGPAMVTLVSDTVSPSVPVSISILLPAKVTLVKVTLSAPPRVSTDRLLPIVESLMETSSLPAWLSMSTLLPTLVLSMAMTLVVPMALPLPIETARLPLTDVAPPVPVTTTFE